MGKLLLGVGIKDTEDIVQLFETVGYYSNGSRKRKLVWVCPYYSKWHGMLGRCYSAMYKSKNPTYADCTVCNEWLYFSKFKAWMETQDWEGKQLDKDLLVRDNKIYSPETCCFTSRQLNGFIVEKASCRGKWLIGVHFDTANCKFISQCGNPITGKREYLGQFDSEVLAHNAWLNRKLELAHELSFLESDDRIRAAIINRYMYYPEIGELNEQR